MVGTVAGAGLRERRGDRSEEERRDEGQRAHE